MYNNLHRLIRETPGKVEVRINDQEYPNKYEGENFFARLARMRQACVDVFLRPYHDDVLWIDADIVEYPLDIHSRLRATGDGIVSPVVLIEGTSENYDTAGMRESFDFRSGSTPPYFSSEGVVPLESVGGCVLVPAEVHRKVQFSSQPDDESRWVTEWWSLCQGAKALGYTVQCNTDIKVYHANLPDYEGENWH